jgi:hypothetical protein
MVLSFVIVIDPVELNGSGVAPELDVQFIDKNRPAHENGGLPRMDLRLWPNPGALTAATWSWPQSVLRIRAVSASPSMSSAIMTRERWAWAAASSEGRISCNSEIFFSFNKVKGFSNSNFDD